jgi:NAD(P)-dependent dehydrogenase (short-subunit alcohol dehydrogenase family)
LEVVQRELPSAVVLPGDVADPRHREQLAMAVSGAGHLDVLVNNASYLGPSPQPALADYPLGELARVYQVDVLAPLALVQHVLPLMAEHAAIVNISSDAAVEAYETWGPYGASKAALDHAGRVLAAEHPTWRVLSVDPGDMRTQMHQDAFPDEDIRDRPLPAESVPGLLALIHGTQPSGRYQAKAVGPA